MSRLKKTNVVLATCMLRCSCILTVQYSHGRVCNLTLLQQHGNQHKTNTKIRAVWAFSLPAGKTWHKLNHPMAWGLSWISILHVLGKDKNLSRHWLKSRIDVLKFSDFMTSVYKSSSMVQLTSHFLSPWLCYFVYDL